VLSSAGVALYVAALQQELIFVLFLRLMSLNRALVAQKPTFVGARKSGS